MRLIFLTLLSSMLTHCVFSQRCGGGIFSFDNINPDQEEITFTVYPFEVSHLQEFKSSHCFGGGAFLSKKEGVTIAPKKWKKNKEGTRQLIPPHGIQI
jgi:hypothetical protein